MKKLPPRNFTLAEKYIFPALRKLVQTGFFPLEVEGLKNLPDTNNVIFAPNHSGWFTLDTFLCGMVLYEHLKPENVPYAIGIDSLLNAPVIGKLFSPEMGFIPSSWIRDAAKLPKKINLAIFPEGADGNCKSVLRAYTMSRWRTGFVRLAIEKKAKVVPIAIIGGEESLPVAFSTSLLKPLFGAKFPIPLSLFPIPTRWKIVFLKPVDFSKYPKSAKDDYGKCQEIASRIQASVQEVLDRETADRPIKKITSLAGMAQGYIDALRNRFLRRKVYPFHIEPIEK